MHSIDFLKELREIKSQEKRRPPRTKLWLSLAGIVVALVVVFVAFLVFTADDLVWDVQAVKGQLAREDYAGAVTTLDDARTKAGRLGAALHLAAPFEVVPGLGPQVRLVRQTIASGELSLEASSELVSILVRLKSVLASSGEAETGLQSYLSFAPTTKRKLLEALASESARLGRARARAVESQAILDANTKGAMASAVGKMRTQLAEFNGVVGIAAPLGELLPGILGVPNDAQYLVVLENSDELRPAGGFIGNYILFHGADGSFGFSDVKDVYALDLPSESRIKDPAPLPMQKYLNQKNLQFRDANWSPDWPTSGANLLNLYRREGGEDAYRLNGAIAVTSKVAAKLSELIGCINIETSHFCPDNFVDELQYQVEKGFDAKGVPYAQRKDILKPLMREFIAKLVSLPTSKYPQIAKLAEESLAEKDIQMWFANPEMEAVARGASWAGEVKFPTSDGFLVADANLGGRKTDPFVQRTVRYSVAPEDGSYVGRISITYTNDAPGETWKTTTYRTYTRVYLPPGTTWIETLGSLEHDRLNNPLFFEGKTDLLTENGLAVFGAFTAVEIGTTRTLTFRFRLAPSVAESIRNGTYALTALREPGALPHALTLDLDFGKNKRYVRSSDLKVDRIFRP